MLNFSSLVVILCAIFVNELASARGITDPTRPGNLIEITGDDGVSLSNRPPPKTNLQSILLSDVRRVALINGHPVEEGEVLNGMKILSINKDSVSVMLSNRTEYQLRLETIEKEFK